MLCRRLLCQRCAHQKRMFESFFRYCCVRGDDIPSFSKIPRIKVLAFLPSQFLFCLMICLHMIWMSLTPSKDRCCLGPRTHVPWESQMKASSQSGRISAASHSPKPGVTKRRSRGSGLAQSVNGDLEFLQLITIRRLSIAFWNSWLLNWYSASL